LPGATSLRTNLPKHDDAAHASWFGCWRIEAELVGNAGMQSDGNASETAGRQPTG
jgi:hypothetical protein